MKKKIAIFANGWSDEFLKKVLSGIHTGAKENNVDLYTFINYSAGGEITKGNLGEASIFKLPDLTMFDGIILFANTFNLPWERDYFTREVLKHHIPAVTLEYELDGIPSLTTDTYSGMYELTTHLIKEHNVKRIAFASGFMDNKENQARLQAVNDALSAINTAVAEEDILYGEWSYYGIITALNPWLQTHELPDAFVCANDEMALGICAVLDSLGISVPEQVLVTGCDCSPLSQRIYPILSTVSRDWDKLGYDALGNVLKQINGEDFAFSTVYSSAAFFGESCGCSVPEERKKTRRSSFIGMHRQYKENNIYEWHLREVDNTLAKITDMESLKNQLGWGFDYDHAYEGNSFLLCLPETFSEQDFHADFSSYMDVYLHYEDEKIKSGSSFKTKDLLPKLDTNPTESNSYLFLPLHIEDNILGYVVFINHPEIVYRTDALYSWTRHMSQNLERVRQNAHMQKLNEKLKEISITDGLTGLKNRTGYDVLAVPLLQKCQKEGKLGAMIFADINRMKQINDQYGHLQGDVALRTVAKAIKRTMPNNWVAVRFGGDEFIMVGECNSVDEANALKFQLSANLEQLKSEKTLSFPLSASFGAVVMNPAENYSLEEYLRKADEAMYLMKQKAHAEE